MFSAPPAIWLLIPTDRGTDVPGGRARNDKVRWWVVADYQGLNERQCRNYVGLVRAYAGPTRPG